MKKIVPIFFQVNDRILILTWYFVVSNICVCVLTSNSTRVEEDTIKVEIFALH